VPGWQAAARRRAAERSSNSNSQQRPQSRCCCQFFALNAGALCERATGVQQQQGSCSACGLGACRLLTLAL
jgi:hypothetical protein